MNWLVDHDILLCREVLMTNPYQARNGSAERGQMWKVVSENLNAIPRPLFSVDQRGVREHLDLLIKRYKRKMSEEEKASGISPEPTEIDIAISSILEMSEVSQVEHENEIQSKRENMESDRMKAESIRKKAMEKVGETKRREDEGGNKPKRQRRSGGDTFQFIRERANTDMQMRREELELKKRKQDLEERRYTASVAQQQQIIQQQQQQNQAILTLLQNFVPQ